jgi:ribosome-associated heat shock protein Hsp15
MTDSSTGVRLDKWLWAARFYKTRGLAVEAIDGGKVQVNGDRAKRAKVLKVGDEVRVRQGMYEHLVEVLVLSDRRGSATVAQTLYAERPESVARREELAERMRMARLAGPGPAYEKGRPTKRDRRRLEQFRDTMEEGD